MPTRTESSGDEDVGLEMSMISSKSKGKREEERRKKEIFLKEQLREPGGRKPKGMARQKSMVSLASEDDLLGRRMLSLAGPLTGRIDEDD
jgi:hypothetical protein